MIGLVLLKGRPATYLERILTPKGYRYRYKNKKTTAGSEFGGILKDKLSKLEKIELLKKEKSKLSKVKLTNEIKDRLVQIDRMLLGLGYKEK